MRIRIVVLAALVIGAALGLMPGRAGLGTDRGANAYDTHNACAGGSMKLTAADFTERILGIPLTPMQRAVVDGLETANSAGRRIVLFPGGNRWSKLMTKILVTQGAIFWRWSLYDSDGSFEVLELLFPDARTITRDNQGWSVELERPR